MIIVYQMLPFYLYFTNCVLNNVTLIENLTIQILLIVKMVNDQQRDYSLIFLQLQFWLMCPGSERSHQTAKMLRASCEPISELYEASPLIYEIIQLRAFSPTETSKRQAGRQAGRYSIYLPRRDGGLSLLEWLVIYGLPVFTRDSRNCYSAS